MAFNKLKKFLELIKFEHTIFALPFAYLGMLMAHRHWPSGSVFFWVTLAMVSARTTGMTLNRILDLKIDKINPRTKNRPLITGELSVASAWIGAILSAIFFFVSAWQLNELCFKLSFVAIFFLSTYHFVKRFSYLCHFALGLVLGIAPMGGWLAVTGIFSWPPVFLSMAVLFWVAGFDILYSLQDLEFDRTHGLYSIPVRFGQSKALKISEYCHFLTAFFLILFGIFAHLGVLYWVGLVVTAGLLKLEHVLIGSGDLARINTVFFTINGWIGILLLIFSFLEIYR